MTDFTTYAEDKILDVFRAQSFSVTTCWVKLHTGAPGEDATSNAATETTRKTATWSAASAGSMTTSADIDWTSVSTTETYTHISIWDAETVGNALWQGALTSSVAMTSGDDFQIASTSLTLTVD